MKRFLLALLLSGCLGSTPDDRRRADIGEGDDPGPEHNPGQPCLLCHGFFVAGTIYLAQEDTEGLLGARVHVEDAEGRTFDALTNEAGNFYVEGGGPGIDDRGRTLIDFVPTYPLQASVSYGDLEQEMVTSIHREGSCSACHFEEPSADSVGRVSVMEPP